MKLFEGKKGLILGVANDRSIAWAVAKEILDQGGVCGFSHLPDKADDEKKKNRMRVSKCVDAYPAQTAFLEPLDVQDDAQVAAFMKMAGEKLGKIDFLLHSIAFADRDDLSETPLRQAEQDLSWRWMSVLQFDLRHQLRPPSLQSRCFGFDDDLLWW